MFIPSINNLLDVKRELQPVAIVDTTPVVGTAIDLAPYEGIVYLVVDTSLATAGDTLDIVVEDSYLGSSFVAIDTAALINPDTSAPATFAQVTASSAPIQVLCLIKDLCKRYVHLKFTAAGSGISIIASAKVIGVKKST